MKITIKDTTQAGPIYQQVKEQIEDLIRAAQLKSGDVMPRTSEVAKANSIPESEIVRAYYELVVSGMLKKVQKKNLFGESMVEHTVS